jgi:hypothetical protein
VLHEPQLQTARADEDMIFFWESIGQPLDELDAEFTHFRESGIFERTRAAMDTDGMKVWLKESYVK